MEGDASKCHCYHEGDKGGPGNKQISFHSADGNENIISLGLKEENEFELQIL